MLDSVLTDFGGGERVSMVVVDTLGKVREPSRLDGYQRDYAQLAALKKIADKHHIALLVVHHLRKMKSDDPFDMISGTQGILGAADGAYVLKRNSRTDRNGKLYFTSRDADDKQYAVQFGDDCRWNLLSTDAEQLPSLYPSSSFTNEGNEGREGYERNECYEGSEHDEKIQDL